jgi:hypothetical protein
MDMVFTQQVADNLSVVLQHDDLLKQAIHVGKADEQQRLVKQQERVSQAIDRIRASLNLDKIFKQSIKFSIRFSRQNQWAKERVWDFLSAIKLSRRLIMAN